VGHSVEVPALPTGFGPRSLSSKGEAIFNKRAQLAGDVKGFPLLARQDEAIAKAVRYVFRQNSDKSIKVNDLVSASGISRRSLELKFIEHIGATPLEEIHRMQLDRIKQLLVETDMSIADLARQTGFRYQEYLARFFKQRTGLTPTKFRQINRSRESSLGRSTSLDHFLPPRR
jgi:transcriptional regulator GlxA family with amidase domain